MQSLDNFLLNRCISFAFLKEFESKNTKLNSLETEKCEIEKQKASVEEQFSTLQQECGCLKEQVSSFIFLPSVWDNWGGVNAQWCNCAI